MDEAAGLKWLSIEGSGTQHTVMASITTNNVATAKAEHA